MSETADRAGGSGQQGMSGALQLDSFRSSASTSDSSGVSSVASTSRPSSQRSHGRPAVTFASPRTLAVHFPDTARSSNSLDPSATATPDSTSAPSSSRLPASLLSSTAHFEHELALQRREFEQRFVDFQQRTAAEQSHAERASSREQIAAMSEQLAVQELFMACQRVELAHFYQQRLRDEQHRLWQTQQAQDRARMESEQRDVQDEQRSRTESTASEASVSQPTAVSELTPSAASGAVSPSMHRSSRPATSSSSLSSVSSVLDAALSAHQQHASHRSSGLQSVTASPFSLRPASASSSSLSASRPSSAALLSPRRAATAAASIHSAFTPPFASAARSASAIFTGSLPSQQSSAAGVYPLLSSAGSVASTSSHSTVEPALADVLALTESLLAQTDASLQAERSNSELLQTTIADMQQRAEVTSRQYDADTAEIREQLRIRATVCSRQEEALHRLTFENHSLVQQIIQLQQQLPQQLPTHPAKPTQPSSHHLPAAALTEQPVTSRHAAAIRDRSGCLFPPIPSASSVSSVPLGRLSKSRFVQPPPAVTLASGFHTASSHASPISTAALGWSQGWKTYSSHHDHSGADQRDESKEQWSVPWSMSTNQPDANDGDAATRAPLLLFPPLQAAADVSGESSDGDERSRVASISDHAEVIVASSPLAISAPSQQHFGPAPDDNSSAPLPDGFLTPAASPLHHITSPTLQPPATPLSPEKLHLHAHFHRPPPSTHDAQPSRSAAVLRQRSAKASLATPAVVAVDALVVQATAFTAGPHAAAKREVHSEQREAKEKDEWGEDATGQQRVAPADESERGWVVELRD